MADAQTRSPFSRPPSPPPAVVASPAPRTTAVPPSRTTSPVDEQSLPRGLVAGLAAAAVGAGAWALITVVTNYQIGWMAVGVGFLVGWAVRLAGKGTSTAFGVLGAALALGGCLAGNLLTGNVVASRELGVPLTDMLARITPGMAFELMAGMFSPIDLLFYGLATYQGYRFSIVGAPAQT
jgi:hypothetical protein